MLAPLLLVCQPLQAGCISGSTKLNTSHLVSESRPSALCSLKPTMHLCCVGPLAARSFPIQQTPMHVQAAGLPRNSPRKEWPLPLLKQILTDSIQETPRQLLARELWCGSGSASEWWTFQAGYTSSTAAFSMVRFGNPDHRTLD